MSEMGFCGEVGLREVREDAEDPESAFDYERFAIDIRVSHSCRVVLSCAMLPAAVLPSVPLPPSHPE